MRGLKEGEISREEALAWIPHYEETKLWLGRFRNEKTKVWYAKALMLYCAHTGMNPSELIQLRMDQKNHEAEKLLDRFVAEADIPQSRLRHISIAVKSFYKWNYLDLARACGRVSRIRKKPYRIPTQAELAKFVKGTNLRDRPLIIFMAVTRVREETVTLLKWRHVWKDLIEELKDTPHIAILSHELKGKGEIRYEGVEQHTFLTPEAKEALLEYKSWRENVKRETITPDSPLFADVYKPYGPLATVQIRKIFERASKRTGLKFSAHDMGRFTQTQLEAARLQPNWIKKIVAHKVEGEEDPYSRPKIEQLREAYRSAVPFLSLTPTTAPLESDLAKMKEEVEYLKTALLAIGRSRQDIELLAEQNKRITEMLRKAGLTIPE